MMAAVLVFAGLALAALVFLGALLGLVLKLAFKIIFFPLLLLKWLVTGVVLLVVGPILLGVGLVLAIVFGVVISIPLLPFLFVAALVWMLVAKSNRRPAVV